jgi:hypothetical protein
MAVPTIANSGAHAADNTTADLAVPYPSGINSGDLLLLVIGASDVSSWSTPSGWAVEGTVNFAQNIIYVFSKTADGTETGNLNVTPANSQVHMGRMYRSADGDTIEAVATNAVSTKTPTHPDITTLTADSLVLCFGSVNDDETPSSFTGETGGDLTLHSSDSTTLGTDHLIYLQTADMASTGTISGGSWSFGGANESWAHVIFALYSASAQSLVYKPHPFNDMLKR